MGRYRPQPPYTTNTTALWGQRRRAWLDKCTGKHATAFRLEVIARVYDLAEGRTQQWYINRAVLDLGHASESVASSICYAEVSGWLVGAGEPPKSVAVTADGVRLFEECGFI
jgi:hypothetical protein